MIDRSKIEEIRERIYENEKKIAGLEDEIERIKNEKMDLNKYLKTRGMITELEFEVADLYRFLFLIGEATIEEYAYAWDILFGKVREIEEFLNKMERQNEDGKSN